MSRFEEGQQEKDQGAGQPPRWSIAGLPLLIGMALLGSQNAHAAINCERTLTADVVALDQPLMFNRLGAQNINSMIYALKDDVVDSDNVPLTKGGAAVPGEVRLRPDKRPRPLVLKIAQGECLTVNLTNLLTPNANPFNADLAIMHVDDQVADRTVGFNVQGMEAVNRIDDISANTGRNESALVPQGGQLSYTLYGAKEGAYVATNYGSTFGSDGTAANIAVGLFGQVVVGPKGARNYRNAVTEEEMRLATTGRTPAGQPIIDYEARYPNMEPWISEGKAGRPILATVDTEDGNRIVHSDGDTITMGPLADGSFPASTYPLERIGKVNPAYPNRLEAFRDFASIWHDEMVVAQAFPGFFNDPVFGHVLKPTRDAFMINYGSGGIGAEIVANRLGVGPMHDCLACEYEEFFLSSYTVGDPAMLVDVPANVGLEALAPGQAPPPGTTGIKATKALFPHDPSNVHHSYIGDAVKIRNTHVGHEHHVFHLHNHQWLFNPNDDNSNFIDAQGIGPGSTYTHELVFGGAGNRNRSAGDAIYHCHFYPHFAQGMWYHLRIHDTFEPGTQLAVSFEEPAGAAEVITVTDATATERNNGRYIYSVAGATTVTANNGVTVEVLNSDGQYQLLGTSNVDATTGAWSVSSNNNAAIVPSEPLQVRVTSDNGGTYPQPEGTVVAEATGFHTRPFALRDGTPAPGARALPDGELVVGSPIPAVVPLPGKAMPPMPGQVTVVPKVVERVEQVTVTVTEGRGRNRTTTTTVEEQVVQQVVGSVAKVDRSDANRYPDGRLKNPGFPFWVAGIEETVGQRAPTPPLDMIDRALAEYLINTGDELWSGLDPAQARGWDGGLPRHTLDGIAAGGVSVKTTSPLDFSVKIEKAKPVFFPEEGTDVEQAAMAFHAKKEHYSYALKPNGETFPASFRTNGAPPMAGSPFAEPCVDDRQMHLTGDNRFGRYFSGDGGLNFSGESVFHAHNPRIYKGAAFQFDAVFNKEGWHYPQQRSMALWEDVWPIIQKEKAPEPMVLRLNTFDCAMFYHTNLIPKQYEADDYQITTPTDIMGQHIHLPKWDLTTTDGAANGWNYEDGTIAPGAIVDRIKAIRAFNNCDENEESADCPKAREHEFFAKFGRADWLGARTTMQRWFTDPVINVHNIDRGLGNVFTHDHYTPSTAQQNGLYATVLAQPAGSTWRHSETGELMYTRPDGGPTSWQAVIETGDITGDGRDDSYREFFLEYSDFQHAYEAGVYVAAGPDGVPDPVAYPLNGETWRYAINPPGRKSAVPLFPDLQVVRAQIQKGVQVLNRPFPQAISVDDPGTFVVNYRNEPIGLRIYDPNRMGPDGKLGMQAEGLAGDLAYALQSRTDRVIPSMNERPRDIIQRKGPTGGVTTFPPHINAGGDLPGDPFTPLLRTYSGDNVRVRLQAGGHEEEHNVSIHGVKWLQGGSGFGQAPNSGWRNAQMAGISEQYTFAAPIVMNADTASATADYLYTVSTGFEGYWNGSWGIMRNYTVPQQDLYALPNNPRPVAVRNTQQFDGVCPIVGPNPFGTGNRPTPQRNYDVVVALANDILPNAHGVTIGDPGNENGHVGAPLNPAGGTLVYNSRATAVDTGQTGPLHDPTAILYVRKSDLDPATGKLRTDVPIEPLILRAAAGDCINVTLENRLPAAMPDLPAYVVHAQLVKRDRGEGMQDQTSFNNNLMRPSAHVGLHTQLLAVDVTRSDGMNVGANPVQTVPPRAEGATEFPTRTYRFYAGDIKREGRPVRGQGLNANRNVDNAIATPVEFAGLNLTPADPIKQPQKGLTGAMVIHPLGSTWTEDADMRAAATVQAPGQPEYRDFAVQWQKGLNMRWADGTAVANIATEGAGVQADPKDNSGMALNYRTEPLWYRFGLAPDTEFGTAASGLGAVANANEAYSNALTGGADPETPVLKVEAGKPFRIQVTNAAGGARGGVFGLHGHLWQRDPYLAQNVDAQGFPDKDYGVGSVRIGYNPIGMWLGGQESILPGGHFTFVFDSAGGGNSVPGDYLMRDIGAFGNLSGRWGILRVE